MSGGHTIEFYDKPFPSTSDRKRINGGAAKDMMNHELVTTDLDTIVVSAREDGFQEVFIGQNRWYALRIQSRMIDRIKYIAIYRVAPNSSITHWAEVESINRWGNSNKYVINFKNKAIEIGPISLVPKSRIKAIQAPRYTSIHKLLSAKNLDDVFNN